MIVHIILASLTIVSFVSALILIVLSYSKNKDYPDVCDTLIPIILILFTVTSITGAFLRDKNHYRRSHKPNIEDVNNGYAILIKYSYIQGSDTLEFYGIKWLGNNQNGERAINNK